MWVTTEPIEHQPSLWRRALRLGPRADPEGGLEPTPGVQQFTDPPCDRLEAEGYHNRALAAGFESELRELHDRKLGHWWEVVVRRPGEDLRPHPAPVAPRRD